MPTPYSTQNQLFSDCAHLAAQTWIYPALFNVPPSQLRFTTTSLSIGEKERILDGEMAIDRIVHVKVQWFQSELEFTVQERFRKPKFAQFEDITITEWNRKTQQKSELFKLNAGIFVYGYFDEQYNTFIDWIAVNTVGLLHRLVKKQPTIQKRFNPRSEQDFLTFKFKHLEQAGLVMGRKG
jgi:hypothetical protein